MSANVIRVWPRFHSSRQARQRSHENAAVHTRHLFFIFYIFNIQVTMSSIHSQTPPRTYCSIGTCGPVGCRRYWLIRHVTSHGGWRIKIWTKFRSEVELTYFYILCPERIFLASLFSPSVTWYRLYCKLTSASINHCLLHTINSNKPSLTAHESFFHGFASEIEITSFLFTTRTPPPPTKVRILQYFSNNSCILLLQNVRRRGFIVYVVKRLCILTRP